MACAMHISDITNKKLNLVEGPTAITVESMEQKRKLDHPTSISCKCS